MKAVESHWIDYNVHYGQYQSTEFSAIQNTGFNAE